MSFVIIVSIVIRFVAMGWSIVLLRRTQDRRMGFLTVMLGLMVLRQTLTLLTEKGSLAISVTGHINELPGLIVSIMAFLVVFFLERIITERKKIAETLRESEKFFLGTLNDMLTFVAVLEPDGKVIFVNNTPLDVAGATLDDVKGKMFYDAFWWQYSEEARQQIKEDIESCASGETLAHDIEIQTAGGELIWIEYSMHPIYDEDGKIKYLVPEGRDITERVLLKAEAAEQTKVEKAIGRVLHEGLSSVDLTVTGQTCLEVAMEITSSAFGFVGELNDRGTFDTTFLADPGWEACRIPRDQFVVLINDMEVRGIWGEVIKHNKALITNEPSSHPASVGTPEGHPPLRCFLGVPLLRGEQAFGAICVANKPGGYIEKDREILERISVAFVMALDRCRAEKALREAHDQLEAKVAERTKELVQANIQLKEMDHLKSMFIASMNHELRTPLNSIIGFTSIILQGMTGEITKEQRKQLTMVKSSAIHLLALINDVIDVSKIEAGKVELAIDEFNLSGLMQEVKDSFTVAAAERGLNLFLEMPKRLVLKSDERRTKQVIMNLVSNAVKFTDRGEIEIKVAKKAGVVEVSVKDTGIGLRKDDMKKLFKAFSRIHIEGRPIQEGTGLGLYLSKKIADLLGAEIKVESEFGKGSVFTFILPFKYKGAKI